MRTFNNIEDLRDYRKKLIEKRDTGQATVAVCGTGCLALNSGEVIDALNKAVKEKGVKSVRILRTGCHGFCERGPVLVIYPDGIFYQKVSPSDTGEIIEETVINKKIIDRLIYTDPITGEKIIHAGEVPFYKKQHKIVLRNCGRIDPTELDQYLEQGGYEGLEKVLESMSPEDVIEEVKKSGLRGRGGAGFPTGQKWEFCRKAEGDIKYVICNGDEGDPGAFMDRAVLEGDPHTVIEGMLIAAYAIGASEGYIYVRAEYPIAVKFARLAIKQAEEAGLLGDNILGKNFRFHIKLKEGAGAFVCGEETALMASIEGKRGMPRPRPPFPAQSGLFGKPTNINNVETFANVAPIILNGGQWYSSIGTQTSKGTKIFALAGKINNTGLVEVPMGITLREVIFDIGGGIANGREFKAVQMGGPSGGCVPAKYLDLPIDYESIKNVGAIMGSGGMIVLDDKTCMVDIARYFLGFVQDESCGKCVPCRIGTKRMLELVADITQGKGTSEHMELLKELAPMVKETSLCGLGQTAPNPVLSTMNYFLDEYEAHIFNKKCPAGVCKALIRYRIIEENCNGCVLCAKNCPAKTIDGEPKKPYRINQANCTKCGMCFDVCKYKAVVVE